MHASGGDPDPGVPQIRKKGACSLCGRVQQARRFVAAASVRPAVFQHLSERHPGQWSVHSWICRECLARERLAFLMASLAGDRGQLSEVEAEIARKASLHETLAADIDKRFDQSVTRGQRVADGVATIGGSWGFVLGFFVVLSCWIAFNALALGGKAFDPYPFILLNLVLSCLAAIQAPIIMMSQNRHGARDRVRAEQDFRVNLKAELEVASLHDKVDHLLHSQWQHLVELQELQLELLNDITGRLEKR